MLVLESCYDLIWPEYGPILMLKILNVSFPPQGVRIQFVQIYLLRYFLKVTENYYKYRNTVISAILQLKQILI